MSRSSAKPKRGLARTRFADDAQRLPGPHRDIDAVHRLDMADDAAEKAALDRKPHFEVVGFDHDRGAWRPIVGGLPLGSAASSYLGVGDAADC